MVVFLHCLLLAVFFPLTSKVFFHATKVLSLSLKVVFSGYQNWMFLILASTGKFCPDYRALSFFALVAYSLLANRVLSLLPKAVFI